MPFVNPWAILGVLVSLIAAAGGGYWRGYTHADRSAEVRALTVRLTASDAALTEARRQAAALNKISEMQTEAARWSLELTQGLQEQIDDYAKALSEARAVDPKAACLLGDPDVSRLNGVRNGGPAARPVAPLPPARPSDIR